MRKENKRIRKEPDAVKKTIQEYCKEVVKRFKPAALFSTAQGPGELLQAPAILILS